MIGRVGPRNEGEITEGRKSGSGGLPLQHRGEGGVRVRQRQPRHPAAPRRELRVGGQEGVRVSVTDNGVGIAPDHLTKIFNHGFTTRQDGNGFGLHNSANHAHMIGGVLTAHSAGPGQGATFDLDLPLTYVQSQAA